MTEEQESAPERLRERVESLPDLPGIYFFLGGDGATLYVGKAKSMRKRAASYLTRALEPRLVAMLAEAADLDYLVAPSEQEALLLENNFIKARKPRFNVLLRDDKTYPYLKLTREPWPRLVFTRRIRNDGAEYFGPYLPGGLARRAIKLTQKLFGIRVCHLEIDGSLPRPCLYWDMKRCLGPCVAGLTSEAEYRTAVEGARLFLEGRIEPLGRRLRGEMEGCRREPGARAGHMALALAAAGADVCVVGLGEENLKKTAEAISRLGRKGHWIETDITQEENVKKGVTQVQGFFGRIDILVNSQGTSYLQPSAEFDADAWQKVMDVNLKSIFLCCKHVGGVMLQQGKGKIINISSVRSFQGRAEDLAYAPSKGAVNQLTRSLAIEWGVKGINVNGLWPPRSG